MKILVKLGLILAFAPLTGGCAATMTPRETLSEVSVIRATSAAVAVATAQAYVVQGQLVVAGKVHRTHAVKQHGHVDVSVIAADGERLHQSVKLPGLLSQRRGSAQFAFKAVFAHAPKTAFRVEVKYHRGAPRSEGVATGNG